MGRRSGVTVKLGVHTWCTLSFVKCFGAACGHLFGIRPFRLSDESARRLLTQLRLAFRGERAAAGHVGPKELRCWQRRKGGSIAK
jgi:hypothetical protein